MTRVPVAEVVQKEEALAENARKRMVRGVSGGRDAPARRARGDAHGETDLGEGRDALSSGWRIVC